MTLCQKTCCPKTIYKTKTINVRPNNAKIIETYTAKMTISSNELWTRKKMSIKCRAFQTSRGIVINSCKSVNLTGLQQFLGKNLRKFISIFVNGKQIDVFYVMYLLSVRLNPQLRNAITYCNRTGKHFSGGLQKCEKRLLASPCPFVRMKQLGSHCTNFDEIWYSSFFSRQSVKKVQASVISTRITSSLHEDVFTSVTISR